MGGFTIKQISAEDRQRVETFLNRVRALLPTNQCIFKNTSKNELFDDKYNLTHKQKIDIIRMLTIADFVEIIPNEDKRYPAADLYVFFKTVNLMVYGEDEEETIIYIKGYILDDRNMEMVIVLSFHEEGLHDF